MILFYSVVPDIRHSIVPDIRQETVSQIVDPSND